MTNQQQRYMSYLLRLWQTEHDGRQVWRFSLESPGTGERQGFTTMGALCEFLQAQVRDNPAPAQRSDPDASSQAKE